MLIDSHCHVQFNGFKGDTDEIIRRSLDSKTKMVIVGSQNTTSERAVRLAEKHDGVWAAVGLHPIHLTAQEVDEEEIKFISREEKFDYEFYKNLAANPKTVAVGEAGFDFFHRPETMALKEAKKRQEEAFIEQSRLADELDLPLILHCRGAHDVFLPLLKKMIDRGGLKNGGVAHCFTADWETAEKYLNLGFYLGFTGIITFEPRGRLKQDLKNLLEVVKKTPLERILVETDAPYLAPEPHRGKRNEPSFVKFVAEKIAELKNLTGEEVAAQTFQNTLKLFKKIRP